MALETIPQEQTNDHVTKYDWVWELSSTMTAPSSGVLTFIWMVIQIDFPFSTSGIQQKNKVGAARSNTG